MKPATVPTAQNGRHEALVGPDAQTEKRLHHVTSCSTVSFVIARDPHLGHLFRSTTSWSGIRRAGAHPVQNIMDFPAFCIAAPADLRVSALP